MIEIYCPTSALICRLEANFVFPLSQQEQKEEHKQEEEEEPSPEG